jgi:serine/threonine protein kinase
MLSADGHYDQSVDIWAAGCIFAELLGRTPLFPGSDFRQTLTMHIDVLGTRPKDELDYIRSEEALRFLAALPVQPKKPWSTLFPDASVKALDLLDKMLQFHSAKRITVDEALGHSYFDSVRR